MGSHIGWADTSVGPYDDAGWGVISGGPTHRSTPTPPPSRGHIGWAATSVGPYDDGE